MLYVGERAADFTGFLNGKVAAIQAIPRPEFKPKDAAAIYETLAAGSASLGALNLCRSLAATLGYSLNNRYLLVSIVV